MDIVTKADLEFFRKQLLAEIRELVRAEMSAPRSELVQGYKTKDVRKILGCSVNKLVALRIGRKIRCKKLGGTLYYNKEDKVVDGGRLLNNDIESIPTASVYFPTFFSRYVFLDFFWHPLNGFRW